MKNEPQNKNQEISIVENKEVETVPKQTKISIESLFNSEFIPIKELTAQYFKSELIEIGEVINVVATEINTIQDESGQDKEAISFVANINNELISFISSSTVLVSSFKKATLPCKATITYLGKVKSKYTYDNYRVVMCG